MWYVCLCLPGVICVSVSVWCGRCVVCVGLRGRWVYLCGVVCVSVSVWCGMCECVCVVWYVWVSVVGGSICVVWYV